jgi:hypothetical protein
MNYITSRLKKFDVHVKTVDSVNEKTTLGAFLTILCAIVTFILLFSETKLYLDRDSVHHMIVDQSIAQETVRVDFDIDFPAITCSGFFRFDLFVD